jgi:chromosome partitioning protein
MSEIIAVVNRKGGVGKTATAQALGAGLKRRGYNVLYIDLDSQSNLTFAVGAENSGYSSLELLTGKATAAQIIQETEQADIIPASPDLAGADAAITGTGKEYRLQEAIEPVKEKYDYIIIDTPAQLGTLTINALTAASSALIPVQAEIYSLQGIGLLNDAIGAVRKYCNRALTIAGILITRYNGRAVLSKDMRENLEEIAQQLNTRLFNTAIRECISIKEAQAQHDIYIYT